MPIASTINSRFSTVKRHAGCETIYVHETKPVWIVHFDAIEPTPTSYGHPEHWNVYYAIEKLKRGHAVWAHNNKRLGEFASLEAAFAAADGTHATDGAPR